jgi:Ca-activated chloride channel family protein
VYHSGVELVTLTVTVMGADGGVRLGLGERDFHVLEEGVPQPVVFFGTGSVPIDLVLMLDTSASMQGRMAFMKRAAINFVRALRPEDRAAIMTVSARATILEPFTNEASKLESAIERAGSGGLTALYDALYIALKEFGSLDDTSEIRRRALVMLSDGTDTASLLSFDAVLDLTRRMNVAVYPIALVSPGADLESRRFTSHDFELRMLARETGARSFFPRALEDLEGVYGSIARELSHQYSLAYTPRGPARPGEFRRVAVTVDAPNVVVRTRSGYVAGD